MEDSGERGRVDDIEDYNTTDIPEDLPISSSIIKQKIEGSKLVSPPMRSPQNNGLEKLETSEKSVTDGTIDEN